MSAAGQIAHPIAPLASCSSTALEGTAAPPPPAPLPGVVGELRRQEAAGIPWGVRGAESAGDLVPSSSRLSFASPRRPYLGGHMAPVLDP